MMRHGCRPRPASGRRAVALAGHRLVPPVVAPGRPRDLAAEPPMHQHVPDRWALGHGLVGDLLHLHDLAAAVEAVGGDQQLRLAVGAGARPRRSAPKPEKHGV